MATKFIENETGTEVDVVTFFHWEGYDRISSVRYPSGRTYALPDSELIKYFTIVRPQEVFVEAYGGVDDRPTADQLKLLDEPRPEHEARAADFDEAVAKFLEAHHGHSIGTP